MNHVRRIARRGLAALLILFALAFGAGCDPFDPVVSVGSPLPDTTQTAVQTEATPLPETPTAAPSETPLVTVAPSAQPTAEGNGSGAYTITADTGESQKTYYSESPDENALRVENGAIASIDGAAVEKRTGDASSLDDATAYGLNAAILVHQNAQLLLNNSETSAVPLGAGGAFVYGGVLRLQGGGIRTAGAFAFGLAAVAGGSVSAQDCNVMTNGADSPAVYAAADGDINMEGGTVVTGGERSPALIAAGSLEATGATIRANNAGAVEVNGGTVELTDCAVTGSAQTGADAAYCVALYRNAFASGEGSAFTMTGGALTATKANLFFATNTDADIVLEGVALSMSEGSVLLRAVGNDGSLGRGIVGQNGANCTLTAKDQTLYGDIFADELSSVAITLKGSSTYTGAVNPANTARAASVTLEDDSTWTLTGDVYLSAFSGRIGSIVTNGYTVFVEGVPLTD